MRELRDVTVKQAIIHLVEPKQGRLIMSNAALQPETDVFEFLRSHAEGGLTDSQAKAVEFVVKGADRAQGLCDRILGSEDDLVDASQELAKLLYKVTEGDKRISDGALVTLICEAATPKKTRLLSLLKLDPAKGYRPVETKGSDGETIVNLEIETDILPSERERLQKAASIRKHAPNIEFRVLALDRQTAAEPAQFFVSKFLGAEYVFDAEARTTRLLRTLRNARNAAEDRLTSSQLVALDKVIDGTLARSSVNLDELTPSLPVPEEIREEFAEKLSEALPDREFELDQALGARLVRKKTFEADNGVRVIVPAEFYDDMVKVEDITNSNPKKRRVVITTERWEER